MALDRSLDSSSITKVLTPTRAALFGLALTAGISMPTASAQTRNQASINCAAEPLRGPHTVLEWFPVANNFMSCGAGGPDVVLQNRDPNALGRYYLQAVEAFDHILYDATDASQISAQNRQMMIFNLRRSGAYAFDFIRHQQTNAIVGNLPQLPLIIAQQSAQDPASLARVTERQRENDRRRASHRVAVSNFLQGLGLSDPGNLTEPERVARLQRVEALRNMVIHLLTVTDDTLRDLLAAYRTTLLPVADSLRLCGNASDARIAGDDFRILNGFLCNRAGRLTLNEFISIATNPNLSNALPAGARWPTVAVSGHGSNVAPISDVSANLMGLPLHPNLDQLAEGTYQGWYQLYFYYDLVSRLDAIVTRVTGQPGNAIVGNVRLYNSIDIPSLPRVLNPETPVVMPTNTPSHVGPVGPTVVVNNQISAEQLAQRARHAAWVEAVAQHDRTVRVVRWSGVGVAAAGAVLMGVGIPLALSAQGEGQAYIDRSNADALAIRTRTYSDAELAAVNADLRRRAAEFNTTVADYDHRVATFRTLAIVGGVVTVVGATAALVGPTFVRPVPAESTFTTVPAGNPNTPHPRTPHTENDQTPSATILPGVIASDTTVGAQVSGTF